MSTRHCFKCGNEFPYWETDNPLHNSNPIIAEVCPDCYHQINENIKSHNAKARKHGGQTGLTIAQWLGKLKRSDGICAYCQRHIGIENLIIEHMIPLSWAGDNTIDNVVPACIPCNSSKGKRNIAAWGKGMEERLTLARLQEHFGLSRFSVIDLAIKRLAIQEGLIEEVAE